MLSSVSSISSPEKWIFLAFSRPLALCCGAVVHWERLWQSFAGLPCSSTTNKRFVEFFVLFLCFINLFFVQFQFQKFRAEKSEKPLPEVKDSCQSSAEVKESVRWPLTFFRQ